MKKASRPRPRDPMMANVLAIISNLTAKQVNTRSKNLVGANTIYNWRAGKVARPQHYTMEAALRAAGYKFTIVENKRMK
jgi:hypothetical protein